MTTEQGAKRTSILFKLQRAAIVLNLGMALSYPVLWVIAWTQDLIWKVDFIGFYTGWSMVRDGLRTQLYNLAVQAPYQQHLLGGRSFSDGLLPYNYPPHTAVLLLPLAWVSLSHAFWLWTLAQGLLLIRLLLLLRQLSSGWQSHERWLLLTATVAFPPLFWNFLLGHFSLWLLVCLLQIYWTLKQGREGLAGLWLALGTLKPQAPFLLVGILLLAAKRWRALASAGLIGCGLVVFSSITLGWGIWVDFLRIMRMTASSFGIFGINPTSMYNFKGALALILGNNQGVLINWICGVALIATILLTFGIWRGQWQPSAPNFELRMALTLLLGVLFSPHLNPPDASMLIAPAALFYAYLHQRQLPSVTYVTFLMYCPIAFLDIHNLIGRRIGTRIPILVLIILMIWVSLTFNTERRRNASPPCSLH